MGAGGNEKDKEKLKSLLAKELSKYKTILEFYQNKGQLNKSDKEFEQHSIIILLILREMEIVKMLLSEKEKVVMFPQLNLKVKKIYNIKFKEIYCDDIYIEEYKKEIEKILNELKKTINIQEITSNYKVSVIDNLIYPYEKKYLPFIIENSLKSKFHRFILNYSNNFIKEKNNEYSKGINIYTKENLYKLNIIKYVFEILIFIKEWINYSVNIKNNIRKELNENEKIICNAFVFNDEKAISLPLINELSYCDNENIGSILDLASNDEKTLDELLSLYINIVKLRNKIKKKIANNDNNGNK
jgi:hypothetical protein